MSWRLPPYILKEIRLGLYLNDLKGPGCKNEIGVQQAKLLLRRPVVSKARAQKMFSYLSRARVYYDRKNKKACGTISFLLWGGLPALYWLKRKLNETRYTK